jgi:hypothetical protein
LERHRAYRESDSEILRFITFDDQEEAVSAKTQPVAVGSSASFVPPSAL